MFMSYKYQVLSLGKLIIKKKNLNALRSQSLLPFYFSLTLLHKIVVSPMASKLILLTILIVKFVLIGYLFIHIIPQLSSSPPPVPDRMELIRRDLVQIVHRDQARLQYHSRRAELYREQKQLIKLMCSGDNDTDYCRSYYHREFRHRDNIILANFIRYVI